VTLFPRFWFVLCKVLLRLPAFCCWFKKDGGEGGDRRLIDVAWVAGRCRGSENVSRHSRRKVRLGPMAGSVPPRTGLGGFERIPTPEALQIVLHTNTSDHNILHNRHQELITFLSEQLARHTSQ
jgi:hypothetical protein